MVWINHSDFALFNFLSLPYIHIKWFLYATRSACNNNLKHPLNLLPGGFFKVIIETLSGDYAMYYCSMSSNEQCCEARQMKGTSDLITLRRVSLLAIMTWVPSCWCLGSGVGVYPSPKVQQAKLNISINNEAAQADVDGAVSGSYLLRPCTAPLCSLSLPLAPPRSPMLP